MSEKNTIVNIEQKGKKEFYKITELKEGDYFIYSDQICMKMEDVYKPDNRDVYANAISLDGNLKIFSGGHDLRLIKSIDIKYEV